MSLTDKTDQWVQQKIIEETNTTYNQQLNQEIKQDNQIMHQEQILRITNEQEQTLNTKVRIAVASFWLFTLSLCILLLFYFHVLPIQTAIYGILGIWILGFIYFVWYFYTRLNDPTTREVVNDAKEYSRSFLRASLPVLKCPSKCKLKYNTTSGRTQPNQSFQTKMSQYPMDHDYWKDGIPNIIRPIRPELQTFSCVHKTDSTREFQSAQPCFVYPGYIDKNELNLGFLRKD